MTVLRAINDQGATRGQPHQVERLGGCSSRCSTKVSLVRGPVRQARGQLRRSSPRRSFVFRPSPLHLEGGEVLVEDVATTRTASSGSPLSRVGADLYALDLFWMSSHVLVQAIDIGAQLLFAGALRGGSNDDAVFGGHDPRAAAVERRSLSGSLREMPVIAPEGTSTRWRPASVICAVRRAPL